MVHVDKLIVQGPRDGFYVAVLPLMSDRTDVVRVEDQTISLEIESADLTDHKIMGDLAIRDRTRALRVAMLEIHHRRAAAAARVGIFRVVVPAGNAKDVDELPAHIRKKMEIIPARTLDEVLAATLVTKEPAKGVKTLRKQTAARRVRRR